MWQLGDEVSRQVYKYRLLPQTSVGPNTTWLCHTEENPHYKESSNALLQQTMISSSTFGFSVLFSVLTRPEHIMIIQVSQVLLGDRRVGFQSLLAS